MFTSMICAVFGVVALYAATRSGLLDYIDSFRGSPMEKRR